jgi:hypothetical protein
MGISPITNLIPLSIARPIQAALEPLPMARVESSARTGDETYSPSGGKSQRGSADEASETDTVEEDLGEFDSESNAEQVAQSNETGHPHPISFFA